MEVLIDLLSRMFVEFWPLLRANPMLFAVVFGTVLFLCFWAWLRSANQKRDKECAAARFDWDSEVEAAQLPHPHLGYGTNAARMTLFSIAAYPSQVELRAALKQRMESKGILYAEWNNGPADGIITYHPRHKTIIVAVAGTDSVEDAKLDADVFSCSVNGWAGASGVALADDTKGKNIRTTSGFAAYAAMAYKGIKRCFDEHDINPSECFITLTGHSLGGACCTLLQLTEEFRRAKSYTYGSARPYRMWSPQVHREAVRVVNIFDPVSSMPIQCRHQKAQTVIVRGRGNVKDKIPLVYLPLFVIVAALYYVIGLAGTIAQIFTGKKTVNLASGHSLVAYHLDLKLLA